MYDEDGVPIPNVYDANGVRLMRDDENGWVIRNNKVLEGSIENLALVFKLRPKSFQKSAISLLSCANAIPEEQSLLPFLPTDILRHVLSFPNGDI